MSLVVEACWRRQIVTICHAFSAIFSLNGTILKRQNVDVVRKCLPGHGKSCIFHKIKHFLVNELFLCEKNVLKR